MNNLEKDYMNNLEKDYIKRWRVLAMLNYIKCYLQNENINIIIDNYIKFATEIDENKWKNKYE